MFERNTRFEKTHELNPVISIVMKLRIRKTILAVDAKKKGPDSDDQKKYNAVAQFLQGIDNLLTPFNLLPVPEDRAAKLTQIYELAKDMQLLTEEILRLYSPILSIQRNNDRKNASFYIRASA